MGTATDAIICVDTYGIEHQLPVPTGPSVLTYSRRSSALVRVEDGDGHVGWGETYGRPGVLADLDALGASVVGHAPARRGRLADSLAAGGADRLAVSAMGIALDDLRARQLGVPVADLYGGRRRDRVRAYASSGGYREDMSFEQTWPAELATALEEGFQAAKFRVGRFQPERELALLGQLREQAGPQADLMVDANGAYSVATAIPFGRALGGLGYRWFEEPMTRSMNGLEYPGYEQLARLDVPVAAGEGLRTRSAFDAFLARGAATIVQPDVAICGGIGEALFVAELAALRGRLCVPHAWGGTILLAATTQLLAVMRDPAEMPGADEPLLEVDRLSNPVRTEIGEPEIRPVDGVIPVPDKPGLGVEIDEASVRRIAAVTRRHHITDQ